MAVLLAACKDGGTETPRPTTVVAASATTQTAVVGTAVAEAPAVRVTDQQGQPLAGAAVTFVVTGGGGTLTGSSATTNAQGVATAGAWTLGPEAGQNTVTATVGSLAPVQFVATAQARTPTTLTALTPTTQTGSINRSVDQAPRVQVKDQLGVPMRDVIVTFAVTAGGGSIFRPTVHTDESGHADVISWTLGPAPGVNTLTASVPGVAPVTFTATAIDPCTVATVYTPMTLVFGNLTLRDCKQGSFYVDFYFMTLGTAQAISLRMSSGEVDSWLEVYDADGDIVALNDEGPQAPDAEVNVFAPAGNYFLAATTFYVYQLGRYELSSSAFQENSDCREYWVVPGITLNGNITAEDCGGDHIDPYLVVLKPGQQLTVRMESAAFAPVLRLIDLQTGNVVAADDDGGGTSAQVVFTAGQAYRVLAIVARPFDGSTGAYALTVTSPQAERTAALRAGPPSAAFRDRNLFPMARGSAWRARLAAPAPR
ncbi:MAG TPA: hypothetical protein VHG08_29000 [Longimicrobium sp.]|nr:hypothetical protein [Longimicrobium sp.]